MKRYHLKSRLLTTFTLLVTTLATTAQPTPSAAQEIAAIMAKYDAVGVSVAVVKASEIIYNQSFGFKTSPRTNRLKMKTFSALPPFLSRSWPRASCSWWKQGNFHWMTMYMNYGKVGNTRILSPESAQAMQTPVPAGKGYGLALTTQNDLISGKIMKGHTGLAYGLNSAMFFQPQEKFGFVVISNGSRTTFTDDFPDIHRHLINGLYGISYYDDLFPNFAPAWDLTYRRPLIKIPDSVSG